MSRTDKNCSICHQEYSREKGSLKDGNDNHLIPSECHHWFCHLCLGKMAIILFLETAPVKITSDMQQCPLCHADIQILLSMYLGGGRKNNKPHVTSEEAIVFPARIYKKNQRYLKINLQDFI